MQIKATVFFSFICLFIACKANDNDNEVDRLKALVTSLQQEIRTISNELVIYDLQGLTYSDDLVELKVNEFKEKRTAQSETLTILSNDYNESVDIETIICADFEDAICFIDNWDIRKTDEAIVNVSTECTYNASQSLYLSAPFDDSLFNIPGLEIEGYINGIEASTIYKIRYWAKYSGTTDKSNGPVTHMIITQDGEWLDYLYEGGGHSPNEYVEKDWKLYSFQISTITSSPLEIIFGTNLEHVFIDDIHIVKH